MDFFLFLFSQSYDGWEVYIFIHGNFRFLSFGGSVINRGGGGEKGVYGNEGWDIGT